MKKSQGEARTVNFPTPSLQQTIKQCLVVAGGGTITSIANSEELVNILNADRGKESTYRIARMLGMLDKQNQYRKAMDIPEKDRSAFAQTRYRFLLAEDAPVVSNRCCAVMKKEPCHEYSSKTNRMAITAEVASESRVRTQKWLQNGCNGFNLKTPKSTPMAFWTEQDILLYIKKYNIPICSVYGDIVEDYKREGQVDGQMNFYDYGNFEEAEMFGFDRPLLKTTGCRRTGCMFCGYGAHCKGDTRFVDMKTTHPNQYKWIMKPREEGGLGYKNVIDWINEHGNLNIRY